LYRSACGHAVFEACTGNMLIEENVSAQTAANKTIKVLLSQCQDATLTERFNSAIIEIKLALQAEQVNKQFLELEDNYTNQFTSSR